MVTNGHQRYRLDARLGPSLCRRWSSQAENASSILVVRSTAMHLVNDVSDPRLSDPACHWSSAELAQPP